MENAQIFGLGKLVTADGITAPSRVNVELEGRGLFARVVLEYSFSTDDPSSARMLVVDRPWDAVLTKVKLNSEDVVEQSDAASVKTLPQNLKVAVEEALDSGNSDAVTCYFESGQSLRTVGLEFVVVLDMIWHKSQIGFAAATDGTELVVNASWDLSGLPGATLECTQAAAESRFQSLEAARRKWSDTLSLKSGETAGITLALDVKKAASLCLYSAPAEGKSQGCGAVVVVAPVRPQLVRKPVRVAVVVEVRNPQEGLLTRELVDQLSNTLQPTDQIAIFFMGSTVTRNVLEWTDVSGVNEEALSQLLDPSLMGRTEYFWESLGRVFQDCSEATHILLSTPGSKESPPAEFRTHMPVFAFATGRKPSASTLEELAIQTGGFLSEQSIDGISSFLKRVEIRLSPPLLRDFRLEGWGLEGAYPPGVTQVYTDKPTLVMGLYDGLLPQTVTLCGYSPADQKLAQRVRVESFSQFDLLPLYERIAKAVPTEEVAVQKSWSSQQFTLTEVARPVRIEDLFELEAGDSESTSEEQGPPSIGLIANAVTLDDGLFGKPEDSLGGFVGAPDSGAETIDDFFAGSGSSDGNDDIFGGMDDSDFGGSDDFFSDSKEDEGKTFLDEEPERPANQPTLIVPKSEDDDGLPRISISPSLDEVEPEPEETPPGFDFGESESVSLSISAPQTESPEPEVEESVEPVPEPVAEVSQEPTPPDPPPSEPEEPPASEEREAPPVKAQTTERATLSVTSPVPEWVRHLSELGQEALGQWLEACPIDHLALALADTDETLASSFLTKLAEPRKSAVEVQIEWGKLLPPEDRQEASRVVEEQLKALQS